jgi:hypothetical protein
MKHIHTFESFLNEAKTIEIKYMMTPPMSSDANRGELDKIENSVQESMNAATFAKEWESMYGEKFATEYKDLYKAMQIKGKFEPADVVAMWDEMYGEDFTEEYDGLYAKLTGKAPQK